MLFNSVPFLIFFAVVTTLFFAVPQKVKKYVLLAASYVFYMWWNPQLILLILFTTLVSYGACLLMARYPDRKKAFLALAAVAIFAVLFFFKYYNFAAGGVAALLHAVTGRPFSFELNILLPVGISFYTFQTFAYVADVYRGKIEAEKNIVYYALFISFFPQLLAGPIERPGDLLPQLKAEHRFDAGNAVAGARMMVIGFFEKIAVADVIGQLVNRVYEDIGTANGMEVAVATCLFSAQILCDFKGYSDIAKGMARIYGITLSDNFDHPYRAASIKDFWNRWHITLSTWFRDYVYFPLGGSRVPLARWCLNILIVFLLSGLWHGADLTFVLWGLLLALYRIGERLVTRNKKAPERGPAMWARRVLTFVLIALAWVLFRSNSMGEALIAYRALFTGWHFSAAYVTGVWRYFDLSVLRAAFCGGALLLLAFHERWAAFLSRPRERAAGVWSRIGKTALYTVMIWMTVGSFIYLNAADVASSFIYFQF